MQAHDTCMPALAMHDRTDKYRENPERMRQWPAGE